MIINNNKTFHTILLAIVFNAILFFPLFAQNQEGYQIDFEINGLQDTTTYLGYYHGESTYIKDTAKIDHRGKFSFSNNESLEHGMYFLVLNRTRLFEITIGKDQFFTVKTDTSDYIGAMKVTGDIGNEAFLESMRFNLQKNKQASPLLAILKDSTKNEAEREKARGLFSKIDQEVLDFQNAFIKKYDGTIMAKVLKSRKPVDVPDAPKTPDGSVDSTFSYRYFKTHYWDNFDLSDPTLLRLSSPLYKNKVNDYLDKLVAPLADSINHEIDLLAAIAKKNQDTYKYFIWTVTLKYQNPKIMGLDRVFVHIFDKYYGSGEMSYWANANLVKNIKERADQLRLSLLGKKAPNMIMQDIQSNPRSLYDIKSRYTVIYFYDPDCGFCKKETPKLKKFYEETDFDVEIFAVSADTSMTKMGKYIKDQDLKWISVNGPRTYTGNYHNLYDAGTTPTIYVLDQDKKIIAKKIGAAKLEEFLFNFEKSKTEQ